MDSRRRLSTLCRRALSFCSSASGLLTTGWPGGRQAGHLGGHHRLHRHRRTEFLQDLPRRLEQGLVGRLIHGAAAGQHDGCLAEALYADALRRRVRLHRLRRSSLHRVGDQYLQHRAGVAQMQDQRLAGSPASTLSEYCTSVSGALSGNSRWIRTQADGVSAASAGTPAARASASVNVVTPREISKSEENRGVALTLASARPISSTSAGAGRHGLMKFTCIRGWVSAAGAWSGNAALPAAGAWAGNAVLPAAGAWAAGAWADAAASKPSSRANSRSARHRIGLP